MGPSNSWPNAASAVATSGGMPARASSARLGITSAASIQRNVLLRGRGLVTSGERERLPAVRRRDEPRRAPRLAARTGQRNAQLGPCGEAQSAVDEAPALQPRVRAIAHVQRLAGLERFDGEAAVVLACADLLLGQLEELVVDRCLSLASVCLKGSIEVERRPGAGDVEAVAARLVERADGAQHRVLCVSAGRRGRGERIQPEGRRSLSMHTRLPPTNGEQYAAKRERRRQGWKPLAPSRASRRSRSCGAGRSATGGAACAAPSPRSDGCVRA